MDAIMCFLTDTNKVDNTTNEVAPVWELSNYSKTFSRYISEHANDQAPGMTLFHFKETAEEDDIPTDVLFALWQSIRNLSVFANTATDSYSFNTFANQVNSTNVIVRSIGDLRLDRIDMSIPKYVELEVLGTHTFKLWLSDEAFRNEYPNYEIKIIPPVLDITVLETNTTNMGAIRENINLSDMLKRVREAISKEPETDIMSVDVKVYPVDTRIDPVNFPWYAVIHGARGVDVSKVESEIRNHIREAVDDIQTWIDVVAKDLFNVRSFYIYPAWERESIPEFSANSRIYQQAVELNNLINDISQKSEVRNVADLVNYLTVTPFAYKGISLAFLARLGTDNKPLRFTEIFPDYVNVGTTQVDFYRMSEKTQSFVLLLHRMVVYAESGTNDISDVDISVTIESGKRYISANFDGVDYHMLTK